MCNTSEAFSIRTKNDGNEIMDVCFFSSLRFKQWTDMSFFQIPTFVYQNHARTVENASTPPLTITVIVSKAIQEKTVRIVRNAHSLIYIF